MLERGSASAGGGRLTSRIGLFLIAIILGALFPIAVVAVVAWRDPLPGSCRSGQATIPAIEGTILYTDQAALWIIEGDLNHPRKLVDYGPPTPASPSPGASVAPSGSTAPAPSATATPPAPAASGSAPAASPASSPTPAGPLPVIMAAAISSDHHSVAFIVADPPGGAGKIHVRVLDPLQATPGVNDVWTNDYPSRSGRSEIAFLDPSHLLFRIPWRFDTTTDIPRLVGVLTIGGSSPLVENAPEDKFNSDLHASWPETKSYRLPSDQPRVDARVIGPGDVVGGVLSHEVKTPFVDRTIQQVVTGQLAQSSTNPVCAAFDGIEPVAFSPDAKTMALSGAGSSYLLDLSGGHAAVFLLRGQLLDWRP